jgi:hypothetical protein
MKYTTILFLPKHDEHVASSRQRSYLYQEILEKKGVKTSFYPLYVGDYFKWKNSYIFPLYILLSYIRRIFTLVRLNLLNNNSETCYLIEKELLPGIPYFIEQLFIKCYILDYDDAVFERNYLNQKNVFGVCKYKKLAEKAKNVLCGSHYILDYFKNKNTIYFPTVINMEKVCQPSRHLNERIKVCWIGTPFTSRYLENLISKIHNTRLPFDLTLIGCKKDFARHPDVNIINWDRNNEYSILKDCDVGIMPLPDEPFERGKCAYKMLQYLSVGLMPIISGVGENQIIADETGSICCNIEDDWIAKINSLKQDQFNYEERIRRRNYINKKYSLVSNFEILESLI